MIFSLSSVISNEDIQKNDAFVYGYNSCWKFDEFDEDRLLFQTFLFLNLFNR